MTSMKSRRPVLATLLSVGLVAGLMAQAPMVGAVDVVTFHSDGNPIIADGSYYSADAAPLVADGKLYIYTGHDVATEQQGGFNMRDYGIFETADVESGDWTHHRAALVPGDVFTWATGNGAYAGHTVQGDDGKYYWYVPVETKATNFANRMAIGVAKSDTPTGPWVDALGEPLIDWGDVFGTSTAGQEIIDPHVFKDTDGKWYFYWGSWNVARVVELNPNMIATVGAISTMSGLTSFFEAPWVVKRNGIYHMVYDWKQGGSSCTPSNYQACIGWATATSPKGPWTYKGIILSGTSATTVHPSIIEFKDQWYITYHTKDAVLGGHFRRSVAIDKLFWDGDTILPVVQTWAKDPKYVLSENIAPDATPTASFTETPPMRIGAVNDGRALTALLPPDQWGNYRGTTSSNQSDWVTYTWDAPVRIDSVGIEFERDGNWIRPPASWKLEYLDASGNWQPVTGATYPAASTTFTTVDFDAVTTTALRGTFYGLANGAYYHSVSISEWEVYAVDATGYVPVNVSTKPTVAPVLPEAVRLTYADGSQGWAPVNWKPIDPAQYASAGVFTVEGRALGYDEAYVVATVTVDPAATTPVVTDTVAPKVSVAFFGTQGADGWYSSAVTATVLAEDDVWYRTDVSVKVGDGEWVTTEDARSASASVTVEGTTTVSGKAVDGSGNASEVVSRDIKIDRTKPTLTATVDADDRSATIAAADALSGLATVQYRFDAGAWVDYVAGSVIEAPDALPHTLHVRAVDVAGNAATASAAVPLGDPSQLSGNVAPYATGTASYTAPWNTPRGLNDGTAAVFETNAGSKLGVDWGTWPRGGTITATLTWPFEVTTDTSGIWWFSDAPDTANAGMIPPREWKLQYLAADGETWTDVVLAEGSTYQRVRNAWNVVEFAEITTKAMRVVMVSWGAEDAQGSPGIREWQVVAANSEIPDTTPPVVSASLDPAAADGADGWYITPPAIVGSAVDDTDESPTLEVSVNGGAWVALDGQVLDQAGANEALVRATDAAGNTSAGTRVSANVDTVEPVSSAAFDKVARSLVLRAADATSGLAGIEYRLPGGEWTAYSGAVPVPAEATSVEFRATDVAGNVERIRTVSTAAAVSPSPSATVTVTASPSVTPTVTVPAVVDQYVTPGFHQVNGRWWYTRCEPYSATIRCHTEIWGTKVTQVGSTFQQTNGWVFNNLTYLPFMTKAQWGSSHLANAGEYTVGGRRWRTECATAATGPNGCRTSIWASYIASEALPTGGYRYFWTQGWLLNNMVRFKV